MVREAAGVLADWHREFGPAATAEAQADAVLHAALSWRAPGNRWPRPDDLDGLTDHQKAQWALASATPLAVLTGTPGTGKTFVAARVVLRALQDGGPLAVCAPTGKAAVRVSEAMREAAPGLRVRATTVHQLLGITRNGHDGRGWGFFHNRHNPLPHRTVVVDEPSMLDADLAAALFSACAPGTHMLLAGDPHQLPPVGHGAPLRDLIASGVCGVGTLSEIRRNAGQIVEACAAIKDGKGFAVTPGLAMGFYDASHNLIHCHQPTAGGVAAEVVSLLGELHGVQAMPHGNVQVIAATNDAGPCSRLALNRAIQQALNAGGQAAAGNPFRGGDKVICTRNGWYAPHDGGDEVYVANGEMGRALSASARAALVEFDGGRRVLAPAPRGAAAGGGEAQAQAAPDCFDLGWAITCHKAQGSQWPVVVVVIDDSSAARRVCTREWLYTAISRAERLCVLVGRLPVAQMMVRRVSLAARKTFMKEILTEVPHA